MTAMPEPFGSFGWICQHAPLPQCNLFFSQIFNDGTPYLSTLFPSSSALFSIYGITSQSVQDDPAVMAAQSAAGTGVGASCEIPRAGQRGSIGDVALIVFSAISIIVTLLMAFVAGRRKAAVGRTELRILLVVYAIHSAFQIVTMSSLIEQGSEALSILSSIHVAVIVVLFWVLLANALVATQIVECADTFLLSVTPDGTPSALVPMTVVGILLFALTLYFSLDTARDWTDVFHMSAKNIPDLEATALFVLTLIWPALAAVLYLLIMLYVVIGVLKEVKPALLYVLAFALFAGAQVIFFLASQPLCKSSNRKINGAFLTTFLDTGAIGAIYAAWHLITENEWGDDYDTY